MDKSSPDLWYKLIGNPQGVPVYVIHTSPFDHNYMTKQFQYTGDTFGFYFFDLPNHGKSKDREIMQLSFLKIAKQIEEFRKEIGHDVIHIIGHGIGGFVAQTYATRFKSHTKSLVISNSAPNSRYRTVMAWNIRDQLSKKTKQSIADFQGKTDHDSLRVRFQYSLPAHFTSDHQGQAGLLMEELERFPSDAYVAISNYMIPKYDVREGLQGFNKPALVISSKHDVWPKSILEHYHIDVPHAKFVEIDAGHFGMIEKPEEYWKIVSQFLETVV